MTDQFINSGNEVVYHYWPQARENKVLLPIGWAFFGGRRVIRELTGKREKTDVKKLVGGAEQRRELYKQFRLYEAEI